MRNSVARTLLMLAVGAGLAAISAPVFAQQQTPAPAHGLRQLTWPGRPAYSAPPVSPAVSVPAPRPARVIVRGGYQINPLPYSQGPNHPAASQAPAPSQGLTPATAYYAGPPPAAVALASRPAPSAPAQAYFAVPPKAPAPAVGAPPAPSPTPVPPAQAAPEAASDVDPMAPRRDAPIFRMAARAPQPAPVEQAPPHTLQDPAAAPAPAYSQSRYYSVHRQYGRQPDPSPSPPQVYLDSLPVDVTGMAGNSDLAEPPAPPTLIRNNNGRLQALPDLGDVGSE